MKKVRVNMNKHRNNLWLRLDALEAQLVASGGAIQLPAILNDKTVDPKDDASAPVWQLETAMGAAIECFPGAMAIEVLLFSRASWLRGSLEILASKQGL